MLNRAFEVSIVSGGRKLEEYDVKLEDPKTMTCYIPSEANKSFSISFKSYFEEASASVRCSIDGRRMGASVCRARHSGTRWGVRVAPQFRQPFQFSELSITEEDNCMISDRIMENLGCIEVKVYRVQRYGRNREEFKSSDIPEIGSINEKSKKAGSHCVSLGAARRCTSHRRTDSVPFVPGEGCWVTFQFRYRPRAILQAQGIIPRELHADNNCESSQSSQSTTSSNRKRRRSTNDPVPAIDNKARAQQPLRTTVTSSKSSPSDSERPPKRLKREMKPNLCLIQEVIDLTCDMKREVSPVHLATHNVGTVIDLTLDD
ncbi:hypothetical protein BXZ70DRAFT_1012029 [Cristinia sonorae]|uniref:DUF7918 domain-containing protein n=1 Tax=Cristinia sonorae TaxID=1940300 RepID=A0A8K0UG97_9AGAR|nr:hypothetical protein BXZ70DRAFT_1012029 [Cristinia sonorae]